ncbi:recombinase family protein [Phyllobacterium zundukense]|uniref:recombinase family protein n=1 Tax=Phyllobacterium zundukense TaxID=1867719 RepID=UPI00396597A7
MCSVVVRLDRLARSVSHLLPGNRALGAGFAPCMIPSTRRRHKACFPCRFWAAQLERPLISERTRAGINAAKARVSCLAIPASVNCSQMSLPRRRGHENAANLRI